MSSADSAQATRASETLIQELEDADVVVIGTPMNNFTVPSVLKAAFGCIGLTSLHFLPLQATAYLDDAQLDDNPKALIAASMRPQ